MYMVTLLTAPKILLIDCVMVIGSEKGYIYPYDIMTDPRSKKVRYSMNAIKLSTQIIYWKNIANFRSLKRGRQAWQCQNRYCEVPSQIKYDGRTDKQLGSDRL